MNFAAGIMALLYGEMDFRRTVQIGSLAGWDSDNPTSTWGGLLGLLYGHEGLQAHFNKTDFSDDYNIARTRFNMPIPLDNFTDMAERGVRIIFFFSQNVKVLSFRALRNGGQALTLNMTVFLGGA